MEFTFNLTEQDIQKVLNALAKEPLGDVIDVFSKIQEQASGQVQQDVSAEQ